MKILGIDPGSRKTGFGVIEKEGNRLIYIESGVLRYDKEKEFLNRLGNIFHSCRELIHKYQPDEIALEALVFVKNINSLTKLAQARGAMCAAFMETHRNKIFEFAPNVIKSTVTGHGLSSKLGVQRTIDLILGKNNYETHDESDALAIAVCHALLGGQGYKKEGIKARTLKEVFKNI